MKRYSLLPVGFVLFFASALLLTPSPTPAADDPSAADKALIAKVSQRLLDVCDPVPGMAWPPQFILVDSKNINAYASLDRDAKPPQPSVHIYSGLMDKVIQGDPDRLALILGHELSHILLHHVEKAPAATDFTQIVFTRDQELAADKSGMELMLKAGFSFKKGKKAFEKIKDPKLGLDYSSFEGLGKDHPSWDDRLAAIDEPNSTAWKAMSAFDNGVFFLAMEDYPKAEQCFDRVTKEFPSCYEAWTNLGFACLMEYCDKLDDSDIRDYGIGQVLIGGFYRHAESIPVRGKDPKLWFKAVGAFNEALRLKEDLTLAKADLGLAYLVHPDGKDVGEATRWLQEAADAAKTDKTLDPSDYAAMLVNLGVVDLAAGRTEKGLDHLQEGEKVALAAAGDGSERRENPALQAALLYNRALQLEASKDKDAKEKALKLFEKYLDTSSVFSLYWPLAYDHYAALCKDLNQEARPKDGFNKARPGQFRLLSSVKLKSGVEVALGEDAKDVLKALGAGREIVAAGGTNIRSVVYDKEGVRILMTEKVVAICLINPDSPELPLHPRGPGADKMVSLRIGMSMDDLQAALPGDPETVSLTDPEVRYRYYRDMGLAVRIVKGHVTALVVAMVPPDSHG